MLPAIAAMMDAPESGPVAEDHNSCVLPQQCRIQGAVRLTVRLKH